MGRAARCYFRKSLSPLCGSWVACGANAGHFSANSFSYNLALRSSCHHVTTPKLSDMAVLKASAKISQNLRGRERACAPPKRADLHNRPPRCHPPPRQSVAMAHGSAPGVGGAPKELAGPPGARLRSKGWRVRGAARAHARRVHLRAPPARPIGPAGRAGRRGAAAEGARRAVAVARAARRGRALAALGALRAARGRVRRGRRAAARVLAAVHGKPGAAARDRDRRPPRRHAAAVGCAATAAAPPSPTARRRRASRSTRTRRAARRAGARRSAMRRCTRRADGGDDSANSARRAPRAALSLIGCQPLAKP